jgi:outer membrane immunogenic protein
MKVLARSIRQAAVALALLVSGAAAPVAAQTYEGPGIIKVGVFAQGAFTNIDLTKYSSSNVFIGSDSGSLDNVGAGMSAGYDWRFGDFFVGVEGDGSFTNGSGRVLAEKFNTDYMWTARLRAGGWVRPDLLLYVTGGWAGQGLSYRRSDTPSSSAPLKTDGTLQGWTVGGGAEYDRPGVTFFAEYLYANFGDWSFRNFAGEAMQVSADSHIVRVGAKFKVGFDYDPFYQPLR